MKIATKNSLLFTAIVECSKLYVQRKRVLGNQSKASKKIKFSTKKLLEQIHSHDVHPSSRLHMCDIHDVVRGMSY